MLNLALTYIIKITFSKMIYPYWSYLVPLGELRINFLTELFVLSFGLEVLLFLLMFFRALNAREIPVGFLIIFFSSPFCLQTIILLRFIFSVKFDIMH